MAKNLYKYPGKKDGYRIAKTVFLNHPPNNPGQNIGEKINIYTLAKKIPNPWQNQKIYKPPL